MSFTYSFPVWMPFISSSWLIVMAMTSSTMSNKSGESNIPLLFSVLRGTLVVFAHWVWCWQWVCHIWPLLCLGIFPFFPFCWEFLSEMGVGFYQMLFSASIKCGFHLSFWSYGFHLSFCLCGVLPYPKAFQVQSHPISKMLILWEKPMLLRLTERSYLISCFTGLRK